MNLTPEFIYWFLIPTIISLSTIAKSISILLKRKTKFNWSVSILITVLVIFSESILLSIFFFNAYPSYIPHIIIGINLVLLIIQILKNKIF